ncbi:MAG: hypothetical protein H6696_00185 [Deferribacteres bacterium]|nr:hypothetical protein [candidate division KSB1 bacterium]MCB9500323.1 hypothetical protein [Deferribacteres bacterium]
MENFENLKGLWQQQKFAVGEKNLQKDMPQIMKKLHQFEKKNTRINFVKTVAISLILLLLGIHLDGFSAVPPTSMAGFVWMICVTLVFIILYWKMQFQLDHLDMQLESGVFLRNASRLLEKQKWLFRWPFRFFVLAMLLGVNLTTISSTLNMVLWEKIALHSGSSFIILLAFFLGIKIRQIRFKKEIDPLLVEIGHLIHQLEDKPHDG